jgi:hypothetical protein
MSEDAVLDFKFSSLFNQDINITKRLLMDYLLFNLVSNIKLHNIL